MSERNDSSSARRDEVFTPTFIPSISNIQKTRFLFSNDVLFFQIRQKIVEVLEWQNIGKTEMSLGGGGEVVGYVIWKV